MRFLFLLLALPALLWSETYTDTNYFTTKTSVVTTNLVIQKKRIVPVKRIEWVKVRKEVTITNTVDVTNVTELTNTVEVTVTNTQSEKKHHVIGLGYSYCTRVLAGYDYIDLIDWGKFGLGLGIWGTYNIYNGWNGLNHEWDIGGQLKFSF